MERKQRRDPRRLPAESIQALANFQQPQEPTHLPMWATWIGLVVAGNLVFFGLRLAARDAR
jgi:hypothetical protein